jgi:GT2 family glycosyltransferase
MPPVFEGFRLAGCEIVAVMDDDAEAVEGWVRGLLRHYSDSRVGGVGGRSINMQGDREADVPETGRVGYVSALGRFVGNMYKRPTFAEPVHVDFFMGGCMSFRRDVARALEFDTRLNQNAAFGYEVDLGLQAREAGWLLVFDPAVAVRHYSAPRAVAGMRKLDDSESTYWYAHNAARVAARRLKGIRRLVAMTWSLVMGERRAPGLVPWLLAPLTRPMGYQITVSGAAFRGRLKAFREARRP